MPEYAYSKQDRERWAREAAAAVAAAAARVRGKMAARLDGKPLPSTVGAVFDQEEWEAELNGEIDAAFGSIAAESAEAFAEGVGARSRFSENAMKVMVGLIAAEVAGQLSTRGEVVADRIEQLMEKGETLEWDGARLAEELGLGEDLSGPLSDALAEAIGNSSATAITEGSAHGVIDLAGLVGNKTWHCVAPGTVVAAAGVTAVARKWFVGEMVRLSTRSGAILSVTPEHRVLVLGRGWVRADELMEGDELVSSRPTEGSTFGDPHIGDRVRVEEVFEASVEVTPSDRVPAVTVDFDGERVDEQVDVVRPARLLVDRLEAAFAEQASEDLLVLCDAGLARLLAGSDRFTLRQRPRSTLPDEDLALAETSNVDAGCSQPCSHSCAGHANFGTDLVARHPVLVEGHEPVGGHLVHAGGSAELAGSTGLLDRFGSSESDFGGRGSVAQHAMTSEAPTDRLGTHAQSGRHLRRSLAALVATDEVVLVERYGYEGHVYDLSTQRGWFLAESGIVVHNCMFRNSRDSHMDADLQTVPVDEPFELEGGPGMYPGDPDLPPEEAINCQCWLTYSVELPSGETVEGEATADELEEGFAEALAAAGSIRSTLEAPSRRTLSTVTDLAVAPAGVQMITKGSPAAAWVAAAEEFGADLDGVIVSVEPTPLQKAALAVGGGEPPERLHVTLCALGAIDTLDEGARQIISSVLASFGPQVGPIEGSIGGIGWFGASDAMTLGLVDAPGLSSLRSVICNALADAGYAPLADHDFTPHVTLAYGQVDATDKVGQPVTFNELRLRWGAEVLAFDLIGSGAPPAAPEPLPEVPPAPPEEVPAVAVDTIPAPAAAAIAFADEPVESTQPPVDIASVPDDALAMELARRLANEAVRSVEDAGGVVPPAAHAMLEQEALHELDEALRDVIEDLTDDMNEPAEAEEPEEPAEVVAEMPTAAAIRARLRARAAALADVPMIGAEGEPIGEIVGAPVETVTCPECGMEVVATEEGLCPGCGAALTETEVVMASEVPDAEWEGVLTVEGVMSGDNRMIGEGSLTWRDLPVPLMLQTVNAPGHDGAVFCGWIHEVERVGASIIGRGTFTDDDAGAQARGILADPAGAKRFGVSVDIDSVQMVFADPSGVELSPDEAIEAHMFGGGADVVEMIVSGRVMGATLTPFPAFQEAHVYLLGPAEDAAEALVASAAGPIWRTTSPANLGLAGQGRLTALVASGGAPDELHPSGDLFQLRPMDEPEPFSVGAPLPDGTIPCYGLVAQWGTCHIGDTARCTEVPRSNDFRSFYTGKKVLTAEGNLLSVGPIIMDTVHPNLWAQASDAQAFYAHTGCAVADVRLYTNEHGIVAAGVVSPDATPAQIRRLRASDISPDWRPMGGEHKLVSLLAVNTSGFLVEGIAASAGRFQPWGFIDLTTGKVGALVAAGAVRNPARRSMATELAEVRAELAEHRALLEALLAPHVEADRRARVAAALDAMGLDCGCDEPAREERLAAALAVFGD